MKNYTIKIVDNLPDWKNIPILEIDYECWGEYKGITAYAQICCNSDSFMIHMWTTEPETRAEEMGDTCYPCMDSCLEFFFAPMEGDNRYLNVEFNANGCYYFGFATNHDDLLRLIPQRNKNLFLPEIIMNDSGWEIYFTIPYKLIHRFFPEFEIYDGKVIKANCYKCAGEDKYKHYLSWNPVESEEVSFHRTESFGTMRVDRY